MSRGVVKAVSATPINPQELPAGQSAALLQAAQSNEPLYRIKVAIDAQSISAYGGQQGLKAGMALDADVVQDHRSIVEWLFEPILAAGTRWKIIGQ